MYCVVVAPVQMNTIPTSTGTVNKKKDKTKSGKKGKKQQLTKNDIGAPSNFQFVLAVIFHIVLLLAHTHTHTQNTYFEMRFVYSFASCLFCERRADWFTD